MRRFTVVCEDHQARQVERLADQYGLTEQEVIRQLLKQGLERVQERRAGGPPASGNGGGNSDGGDDGKREQDRERV